MATALENVREMARRLAADEGKLDRIREKAQRTAQMGLEAVAIQGSAFAFGYANGRLGAATGGEWKVAGKIPVDLTAAVVLYALSFTGQFGKKYDEIGRGIAAGTLAQYLGRQGQAMGAQAGGGAAATGWNPATFAGHAPQILGGGAQWPMSWDQSAYATRT